MAEPTAESTTANDAATASVAPRRRWRLLAWLLVLALFASLAAGGWLLWRQLQELRQQQAQLAPAAELDRRAGELAQSADALRQRLDSLAQDAGLTDRGVADLRLQLDAIGQTQRSLAQRVDVREQVRRGEWARAEASYLVKVAGYRLRFYRDVDGALAALRLADQTLARQGSDTIRARQAINRAVDRLVTVSVPDIDALAARLEALISKIDILPLDLQIREAAANDQAAPPAEGWRGGLQRAWLRFRDSLGQLVVVRRDRRVEPLIVPEERYFLYHNLRLRLESARLALVDGDQALYRRSLDRADEWIVRYYVAGEPEVEQALDGIRQLRALEIAPELPDIAPLLQAVTDY